MKQSIPFLLEGKCRPNGYVTIQNTSFDEQNERASFMFNADCLPAMKKFPDNYFDFAICDIPYCLNASKPTRKKTSVQQKNGSFVKIEQKKYEHSDWDSYKVSKEYFTELSRISKNQIIFGGNYYGLEGGYLVWNKVNGESDQYGCELAWLSFTKRTDIVHYMFAGMMQGEYCGRDMKKALKQIGNKKLNEVRIHETQKPVKLYDWILEEYVPKGSKVIDTHVGSGSNRIANYWYGNDFYGWEIDQKKFENQEKRFKENIAQQRLEF